MTGPALPAGVVPADRALRSVLTSAAAALGVPGCENALAVPEGRRARYELADARIGAALDDLVGLVLAVDPACCPAADTEDCC